MIGALVAGITGSAAVPNSYESIATLNAAAGGSASLEFTSIPSTYTHLQIRGIWLNSSSGTTLLAQLNSDTGANYKNHYLYGSGASASAGVGGATTGLQIGYKVSNTNTYPDAIICDILDYKNTNKYKTARSLDGSDENGSGHIELQSGLWLNTAAISSIKLVPGAGTISQYSTFALYGIKEA